MSPHTPLSLRLGQGLIKAETRVACGRKSEVNSE